jgi:hypothetical protein
MLLAVIAGEGFGAFSQPPDHSREGEAYSLKIPIYKD